MGRSGRAGSARRTVVVLVAALAIAASSLSVSSASTPTGKAIDRNGTLRYAVELNNRSAQLVAFDPATSNNTNDVWNLALFYDTLLYPPTKTGKYEPALAESYEIVDEQTIAVTLREDLTFHDGEALDAEAARASILRNLEAANPSWNPAFSNLDTVEVVSPTEFNILLKEPGAFAFLPLLSARETMVVSPAAAEAGTLEDQPVGAGPFVFETYEPEELLSMTRFEDYWNVEEVRVGQVDLVHTVAGAPRVASLLSDRVDVAPIAVSDVAGVEGRDDVEVKTEATDQFIYTQMCKNEPPFDDVKVRRAFSLAIDRDELNQAVYQGLGTPAYMTWSKGTPYYVPSIAKAQKYNPKRARKLLAEAGYEDGFTFSTMIVAGFPPTETLTTVLKEQLAKVNITLEIEQSTNYAQEVWAERQTDTATPPWIRSGVENTVMFDPGFQANLCTYDDPELNELRENVLNAEPGSPEVKEAWTAWMEFVHENMLVIYHLYPAAVIAYHSDRVDADKFSSLYPGVSSQFFDWTQWTVKKG